VQWIARVAFASELNFWMAALAAAVGIIVFFAWANRQTAKAHAPFTPKDVEIALTELLDPQAHDHDTRDLFLAWPIDDPYLESIRLECLRICQECPPVPGKDINEEGEKRVATLLADLRRRNSPSNGPADALSTSR
jgi:hypothetical protein